MPARDRSIGPEINLRLVWPQWQGGGTVSVQQVALVGLHSWTDDDHPHVADWGLQSFGPDELRGSSGPLLEWLAASGCSRVTIHFDVDTVDSNEIVLGLGAEPNGLTSAEVRRIVGDVEQAVDVFGFTIAEFFPRQVMHLRQILQDFPLINDSTAGANDAVRAETTQGRG
jgi:arginase